MFWKGIFGTSSTEWLDILPKQQSQSTEENHMAYTSYAHSVELWIYLYLLPNSWICFINKFSCTIAVILTIKNNLHDMWPFYIANT